jgi:carboxyl-terminal processing protease
VAAADLTNLAPIKKNLVVKRGSVNLQVFAIQQRLKLLGYSKYKPNGTFGKDTERDLKHFQTRHGLPSTGIFDNYTYINMSSDMGRLANPQPKDMVLGTAIQLLKNKAK